MKRRVNLTLDKDMAQATRRLAKARGRSLSGLVKETLGQLIASAPDLPRAQAPVA